MDITEFLAPDEVILDVRAPDKPRLLHDLCQRAAVKLELDAGVISDAILKREALGSTGTGDGIAIPHARVPGVQKPFGLLARLKRGIDYAAIDEKPVDVVFLLVLPAATGGEQLNALACVARKLRDARVMTAVRRARTVGEMFDAMAAQ